MKQRSQGHRTKHRHMAKRLLGLLLFAFSITVIVVMPNIWLQRVLQNVTGSPLPLPLRILLAVVWIVLVYLLLFALGSFAVKHHHKTGGHVTHNMFDEVMDALDQMSSGNYNVYVQRQDKFLYSQLADKVNGLARDLSSVEQMRQEFVSNVSHEIQSPLTSIRGFAVLLKKDNLTPEDRLHYIEVIEAESRRLSKLSDNLLKLSALDAGQTPFSPILFRLDKQIETTLLVLEPQWLEKGLEIELDLAPVDISGDEELLSQVWMNLLHNAVKFTPQGGAVVVSLTEKDNRAVCTISDTGPGIPQESLPRVFERFYKADKARDRSVGGNGLGLSLVQKILHLHGGTIWVSNLAEGGACFSVSLPLARPEPA